MAPETAARPFAEHPDLVMCGALNPQGRAQRVDGGWTADRPVAVRLRLPLRPLLLGPVPGRSATGAAPTRSAFEVLVPRDEYEILDTWHVNGLQGTGSHDVAVHDLFVPDEMVTEVTATGRSTTARSTGYRRSPASPTTRSACHRHRPRRARRVRRPRRAQAAPPLIHAPAGAAPGPAGYAEAEAALRGARAFVLDAVMDEWDTVCAGGVADRRQRALVRLAARRPASRRSAPWSSCTRPPGRAPTSRTRRSAGPARATSPSSPSRSWRRPVHRGRRPGPARPRPVEPIL